MLDEIKKIQGINHTEFDTIINMWIDSAKLDLKGVGIADTFVNCPNSLFQTAIVTYVLSHIDVVNAELYANSYAVQKDVLRHNTQYISGENNGV